MFQSRVEITHMSNSRREVLNLTVPDLNFDMCVISTRDYDHLLFRYSQTKQTIYQRSFSKMYKYFTSQIDHGNPPSFCSVTDH